jgi:predicted alpha/beta superfamily hydrolase
VTAIGHPAVILDSRSHVVHSAAVGDDYLLDVWLPESYEGSALRYPVLYLLDSPGVFGLAVNTVMTHVWEDLLPELIVVGIGKPMKSLDEWWPVRTRDYSPKPLPGDDGSGHSDAFQRALQDEILPVVDTAYRTDVADRTIYGHSLGGVFALRLLLNGSGLFRRYLASSPAVVLDGQTLLDLQVDAPPARSDVPGRLFVSIGTLDNELRPHIEACTAELRLRDYQGLHVDTAELSGYGHASAAAQGFLTGLRRLFPNVAKPTGGQPPEG